MKERLDGNRMKGSRSSLSEDALSWEETGSERNRMRHFPTPCFDVSTQLQSDPCMPFLCTWKSRGEKRHLNRWLAGHSHVEKGGTVLLLEQYFQGGYLRALKFSKSRCEHHKILEWCPRKPGRVKGRTSKLPSIRERRVSSTMFYRIRRQLG